MCIFIYLWVIIIEGVLIPLQKHLHDTMTQTFRLCISMATPLLSPGARVTHSGELIRAVVTSAILPLGAFEDDSVCVAVCILHVCLFDLVHVRFRKCARISSFRDFCSSFMSHLDVQALIFYKQAMIVSDGELNLVLPSSHTLTPHPTPPHRAHKEKLPRKVKWDWSVQIISE